MRALFIGFALLVAVAPDLHARMPTQAEIDNARRATIAPLERRANDCIIRAIVAHPRAPEAVRRNAMRPVFVDAIRRCGGELSRMRAAVDQALGPGAGDAFIRGPFFNRLRQTMQERLGPELARREQARAPQAQATPRPRGEVAQLEQARDLLNRRMFDCINRELASLVRSNEAAAVLAQAAMTVCHRDVTAAIDANINVALAQGARGAGNNREQLRGIVREHALTNAVRLRAEYASAAAPTQPAPRQERPAATSPSQRTSDREREAVVACIGLVRSRMPSDELHDPEQVRTTVANLCRPEIEGLGRAIYLTNGSTSLDEGRSRAMAYAQEAIEQAGR